MGCRIHICDLGGFAPGFWSRGCIFGMCVVLLFFLGGSLTFYSLQKGGKNRGSWQLPVGPFPPRAIFFEEFDSSQDAPGGSFLQVFSHGKNVPPLKTNMTMENQPFEHVFPIQNGDFPLS